MNDIPVVEILMDLVDLNQFNAPKIKGKFKVEILMDLVDLNSFIFSYSFKTKCRDPYGSRGSK